MFLTQYDDIVDILDNVDHLAFWPKNQDYQGYQGYQHFTPLYHNPSKTTGMRLGKWRFYWTYRRALK
jgi:hypothetical protein